MFVGLVRDPGDGLPPEPPSEEPPRPWRAPPWRPFAWVAAFCWLLVLAGTVGGLAGYVLVLVAFGLGCWRVERWLSRQYWGGLSEWHG